MRMKGRGCVRSYLKATTDFIKFIENTPITDNNLLATLDISSLYKKIPHFEGMDVVCRQYEIHYGSEPPIPVSQLRELMRLILDENSFKFTERHYVQTQGIALGTKMAVAFSVIFMTDLEERLPSASPLKPSVWKRFIDDVFSLWDIPTREVRDLTTTLHPLPPTPYLSPP